MVTFSVTGEVSLDRLRQPGLPDWEGLGGCATYLSLALARQGQRVLFATAGGHDVPERFLEPLVSAGIDVRLERRGGHTAHLELDYDRMGEIARLRFESGVEKSLGLTSLPTEFWGSDWILMGTAPHGFQREVVACAKSAVRNTALSTQGEFDGQWDSLRPILPELDVLFINSREVVNLRGATLVDGLLEMCAVNPALSLVVTCGERGAFVFREEWIWWVNAFRGPVVNATGAGDTFAATWLDGFAHGRSMEQALPCAAVAASMTLRDMGHTAIPTRESLDNEMSLGLLPTVIAWNVGEHACRQALSAEDRFCHWTMPKTVE